MTDAPERRPTVVIVEDEALVAMMVADTLADAGYRTVWSPGGRGAGAGGAAGAVPDAAVVDLRLANGLDGRDVVRRLREQCAGMPVVVITDLDRTAPEADLRGLGGPTARLRKPFSGDHLLGRLEGLLEASGTVARPSRRAEDAPAHAG
jgi:DNA-binding response OmpR family regulator